MKILVLNSGSSSQKACLYEIANISPGLGPTPRWERRIEWMGDTGTVLIRGPHGSENRETLKLPSRQDFLKHLLNTIQSGPAQVLTSLSI